MSVGDCRASGGHTACGLRQLKSDFFRREKVVIDRRYKDTKKPHPVKGAAF